MGKSTLRILIRSTFTAYLLTAIALVLLALGLYKFHLTETQVGLGVKGIYILVCMISGIIAGKMAKTRRFLWGFFCRCGLFSHPAGCFLSHQPPSGQFRKRACILLRDVCGKRNAGGDDQLEMSNSCPGVTPR